MRVVPQSSHCSTWPPSAAVRHAVMARHDATLDAPEMAGVRLPECFAMAAEDIRHLQSRRPWHPLSRVARLASGADRAGSACLLIVLVATRV